MKQYAEPVGYMKAGHGSRKITIKVYYAPRIKSSLYAASLSGHRIIVDDNYLHETDRKVKEFAINHELGHIFNRHNSVLHMAADWVRGRNTEYSRHRNIVPEYVADMYAYGKNPEGTVYALKHMYESVTMQHPEYLYTAKELELRYKRLGGTEKLVPYWYRKALESRDKMGTRFGMYAKMYEVYNNAMSMTSSEMVEAFTMLECIK